MAIGLMPVLALVAWRWNSAASLDVTMAAGCVLHAIGLPLWHAWRLRTRLQPAVAAVDGQAARDRASFDVHPLPTWIYDVGTLRVVDVNRAAVTKYGYSREQFLQRSITDLRPAQDVEALKECATQAAMGALSDGGRWRHQTASGQLITVDVYECSLDFSGSTLRIVCAIDRSAEQDALDALQGLRADLEATVVQRTAELKSREETYRVLAELSPQILWQADSKGKVTYVSRSWNELVGVVAEDGKSPRWLAAMHPDDRAGTLAAFEAASGNGQQMRVRRRFRSPQGGYRPFLSVGAPVPGPDGSFGGWVGVDTDISELERHAVRLAQTNADVESMSYTVSHDLRAPVQVIRGFVEAILSNRIGRVDDAARGALVRVQRNALRMDELITDLLALSRLSHETVRLQCIDPLALARDAIVRVQDRHPGRVIEWITEWRAGQRPQDPATAWADRRLLQVVLENLLDNAVKFTVGTQPCRIEVLAYCTHDATVLRVRDRGVGFPAEMAERLFRPFQRLHPRDRFRGTGVGLATAKRIVQLHGGTIDGRNRNSGGAVFEIRLPLQAASL